MFANIDVLRIYHTILIICNFLLIIIDNQVKCSSTNKHHCSPASYDRIKNWKIDNDDKSKSMPANITTILRESILGERNSITAIELWARERRENFNLMILANPFVEEESHCQTLNDTTNKQLRHFVHTCDFFKDDDENLSILLGHIFTGCYYFFMGNKEEKYWQFGPVFYNTSYRYLNTKLDLLAEPSFKPESTESTMELIILIKVPLKCMEVRAQLYQLQGNVAESMNAIRNNSLPESQKCWFEMINEKVHKTCQYSPTVTDLQLIVNAVKTDISMAGGWTAKVTWNKLQPGGGTYYIRCTGYTHKKCDSMYAHSNLNTWLPVESDILIFLGHMNLTNEINKTLISESFSWMSITCGSVAVAIIVTLFYWIKKYHSLWYARVPREEKRAERSESLPLNNMEESSEILLVYDKGSSLLMNEIDRLKRCLQENCSNYHVHDVYATNEWDKVCELGVAGWIQELLKDGSKIIWVDTPDFRSCLIDKQKQYTVGGFRADAIPYTVSMAMDSFQDPATQYRRHFVVRVKGFQVEDGDKDPLQVITPHARYCIPDQLSLLCEHLKGPMEISGK